MTATVTDLDTGIARKLTPNFTYITDHDPGAVHHPAWEAFKREMDEREYGRGPMNSAWYYFSTGWDARKPVEPEANSPTSGKPEQSDESKWAETWREP